MVSQGPVGDHQTPLDVEEGRRISLQIMSSLEKTDGSTAWEESAGRLERKAREEEEPGRWAMD